MELKIPPVLLVFITCAIIWLSSQVVSSIEFVGQELASIVFFCLSMIAMISALVGFRRQRTTVDPTNPDKVSSLVTDGIYKITRNPMYLSMAFLIVGLATGFGHPVHLISVVFFIWYMTKFQIKPE